MLHRISMAALVVTSACAVEDDLATGEIVAPIFEPCPTCINNSPVIDSIGFHELHEGGAPNAQGFQVLRFDNNGTLYDVDVKGGALRAYKLGFPTLFGAALIGPTKRLVVRRGSATYRLAIEAVTKTPYWNVGGTTESYRVTWTKVGGSSQAQNVCPNPPDHNIETLGLDQLEMVIYEGDRIDADTITVFDSADIPGSTAAQWFNLGCSGHTLSKLHLTHHSYASKEPGFVTSPRQRQAMLKMFTGDYIGDGTVWTIHGAELRWSDFNWFGYATPPVTIEARWNEYGAICLEVPRLQGVVNAAFPPDIDSQIEATGKRPPSCSELGNANPNDPAGAHLVSALPW
jgi:hypothetical protein